MNARKITRAFAVGLVAVGIGAGMLTAPAGASTGDVIVGGQGATADWYNARGGDLITKADTARDKYLAARKPVAASVCTVLRTSAHALKTYRAIPDTKANQIKTDMVRRQAVAAAYCANKAYRGATDATKDAEALHNQLIKRLNATHAFG